MEEVSTNTQTNTNDAAVSKDAKTDYKALYEATLKERDAEKERTKNLEKDLCAYKDRERKSEEERKKNLPTEERQNIELDEKDRTIESLMSRIERTDVEKVFSSSGYKEDEYYEILDCVMSNDVFDKEKRSEHRISFAKKILEFAEKQKKKAIEENNISSIRSGIQYPNGNGSQKNSEFSSWKSEKDKFSIKTKIEL